MITLFLEVFHVNNCGVRYIGPDNDHSAWCHVLQGELVGVVSALLLQCTCSNHSHLLTILWLLTPALLLLCSHYCHFHLLIIISLRTPALLLLCPRYSHSLRSLKFYFIYWEVGISLLVEWKKYISKLNNSFVYDWCVKKCIDAILFKHMVTPCCRYKPT